MTPSAIPIEHPPPGFVHIDVDGLWTLAAVYGFPEGDLFDSDPVFERGLPRLAELLAAMRLPATLFYIGRDLTHPAKARLARELADRGFEAANHSWSHRLDLNTLPPAAIEADLRAASEAIERAAGRRPVGFRAPGYAAGTRVLAAAARAGLRYDGSSLPTCWGGALRWAARRLRAGVRRERGAPAGEPPPAPGHYGRGGSLAPQWFDPGAGSPPLLRLPLAVSPLLRLPLHASLGMTLGERAVTAGLRRLARRGYPIMFLLHGLDAVGIEELQGRLPRALLAARAFRFSLDRKLAFLRAVLEALRAATRVDTTERWIQTLPLMETGEGRRS